MAQRKPFDLSRISPLTDFLRNHKVHVESLKSVGEPLVLTINGKAELVVLSTAAFQALQQRAYEAEVRAALLEGMLDVERGNVLELEEAVKKIESDLDL